MSSKSKRNQDRKLQRIHCEILRASEKFELYMDEAQSAGITELRGCNLAGSYANDMGCIRRNVRKRSIFNIIADMFPRKPEPLDDVDDRVAAALAKV